MILISWDDTTTTTTNNNNNNTYIIIIKIINITFTTLHSKYQVYKNILYNCKITILIFQAVLIQSFKPSSFILVENHKKSFCFSSVDESQFISASRYTFGEMVAACCVPKCML